MWRDYVSDKRETDCTKSGGGSSWPWTWVARRNGPRRLMLLIQLMLAPLKYGTREDSNN